MKLGMTSKRFIAYLLDFLVVSALMWPISFILFTFANPVYKYQLYHYFVVVAPVLIILYFVFCEKLKGTTVGKLLMFIEVQDINGGSITYKQAIIRNISKLWWFPIIFDWAIGQVYGDKKERVLGQLSKTKIVEEDKSKFL